MIRIRLTVAYVGTRYHGWQIQARKSGPPLVTVQSVLEEQVSRIAGMPVHVHGAGRTDAGVHADAQVAHMDVPERVSRVDWQLALNTSLPSDIRIVEAVPASTMFHAQFDALRKVYCYRLWLSRRYTPPRLFPFVWACGPLNVARMDEAAELLIGTRDFSSLRNRGDVRDSVRTLYSVTRSPVGNLPAMHQEFARNGADAGPVGEGAEPACDMLSLCGGCLELAWRFEADGFLKQMVRNAMGLLVAVGRRQLEPEAVPDLLARRDRRHVGMTAPACGLTLERVIYPGEETSFAKGLPGHCDVSNVLPSAGAGGLCDGRYVLTR